MRSLFLGLSSCRIYRAAPLRHLCDDRVGKVQHRTIRAKLCVFGVWLFFLSHCRYWHLSCVETFSFVIGHPLYVQNGWSYCLLVAVVLESRPVEAHCCSCYCRGSQRVRFFDWLIKEIDSGSYDGLRWEDDSRTTFRIPWKHNARKSLVANDYKIFQVWIFC